MKKCAITRTLELSSHLNAETLEPRTCAHACSYHHLRRADVGKIRIYELMQTRRMGRCVDHSPRTATEGLHCRRFVPEHLSSSSPPQSTTDLAQLRSQGVRSCTRRDSTSGQLDREIDRKSQYGAPRQDSISDWRRRWTRQSHCRAVCRARRECGCL